MKLPFRRKLVIAPVIEPRLWECVNPRCGKLSTYDQLTDQGNCPFCKNPVKLYA